jgi:hypothetical protein
MKMNCRYFCLGSVVALSLLLAAGAGVAGPDKDKEKGKQKISAPARSNAMPEVVLLRGQVYPHGESVQSKRMRGPKKHAGKKGFRTERGLRANRPQLTRDRIVVVPGEFTQFVEVRAVPPGKGKPDKGKPKSNHKSAKSAH